MPSIRARVTYCAPILGGVDAATYAVDLDVGADRGELVVRIHTLPDVVYPKSAARAFDPR